MSTPTSDGPNDPGPDIDPLIQLAMRGLPDDFSDFPRVYQDELRPALRAKEEERQAAAKNSVRWSWVGAVVALLGVIFGFFVFRVPQLAIVAGIIGFAVHGAGRGPLNQIGKRAKQMIIEPVTSRFGMRFDPDPGVQDSIVDLRAAGLVPDWDRSSFEDRLTGERSGVTFEFFEANLQERRRTTDSRGRSRTRWVTVFDGQCLRFRFHKDFLGRTVVLRDAGFFNRFSGRRGMQRVKLESNVFEDAFEVYSTDQVEARFLLTPDLMQRLIELEKVFRGGKLRCAFKNNELLIALEGGDLFEPGSMFTPLDNPERVRELLDDFAAIFNLIDSFADPKRLPKADRT
ncbi:MAG: DUF3137 domain-containing protein [Hyphomonadaceae bacterium]|nr:DUF3137 domain-containing protein [Hyphomonadaceae bacterium]